MLISKQKAESIIDFALSCGARKAQGLELSISANDIATSRFACNSMTQNQAPRNCQISLRLLKDGKQVRLSCDELSRAAIIKLVDDALRACKHLERDPDLPPLSKGAQTEQGSSSVKRFDKYTAELSAASRAIAVKEIIDSAEECGLEAAGIIASGSKVSATGNSRGLFQYHRQSHAECSVTMSKEGGTGWAKASVLSFAELNQRELAKRAAEKALLNQNPLELPPGRYRVILEPSAVLDLLSFLASDFAATSHLDKLSCLEGKLGKQVFGKNISIKDDCRHPLQAGEPFDAEGLPRQSLWLVRNGVLENLVYGKRSAAKMNCKSSGHGLPEPTSLGELPQNLVMEGADSSISEMIASQEKAILLSRVWYIREVDPMTKLLTGMTRDGSFLVENGRITRALKNLRFNQSLIELLQNVIALGPAQRAAGEEGIPAVVPALLVDGFNFSSGTTF